jgi:hypothetical protein
MAPSERLCGRGAWVFTMLGAHQKKRACGTPWHWGQGQRPAPGTPQRDTPRPQPRCCACGQHARTPTTAALGGRVLSPEPRQPSGGCGQARRDRRGQTARRGQAMGCGSSLRAERAHPAGGEQPPQPTGRGSGHPYASGAASLPGAPGVTQARQSYNPLPLWPLRALSDNFCTVRGRYGQRHPRHAVQTWPKHPGSSALLVNRGWVGWVWRNLACRRGRAVSPSRPGALQRGVGAPHRVARPLQGCAARRSAWRP